MVKTRQAIPGFVFHEHEFEVPLDHADPDGTKITVFAREVTTPGKEGADLPWLVFLQGGPGFAAPRPVEPSGWVAFAAERFRVLLLDQRGTGRSTPVSGEGLERFEAPEDQAAYLTHFRADSIVADAEHVRRELLGDEGKWTLLGQSYGGFCALHYLSAAPEGLARVLITGGVPGLDAHADDVYRLTYGRLIEKNRAYYERYPGDVERVREVAALIEANEVQLPGGDRLSVRAFQQLGISFGMSDGYERLHYLLESAFSDGREGRRLAYSFLRGVEEYLAFSTNPIYAILHEHCYTQGSASNWSAERVRAEFSDFDAQREGPLFFTGEMVYPWMFEENRILAGMREAAQILARKQDWPRLYDAERLARNEVPIAAAVYHDDAYVPRELSLETAGRVPGLHVWITNEYEHNGLRADGSRILERLLALAEGEA